MPESTAEPQIAEGRGRTRDSILVWRPRSDALSHEATRTHSGALTSTGAVMRWLPTAPMNRYARCMPISNRQLLDALSRTPFTDSTELAGILGEPHTTVHRTLADLLAEGIIGRASHGTDHLAFKPTRPPGRSDSTRPRTSCGPTPCSRSG